MLSATETEAKGIVCVICSSGQSSSSIWNDGGSPFLRAHSWGSASLGPDDLAACGSENESASGSTGGRYRVEGVLCGRSSFHGSCR